MLVGGRVSFLTKQIEGPRGTQPNVVNPETAQSRHEPMLTGGASMVKTACVQRGHDSLKRKSEVPESVIIMHRLVEKGMPV